MRFYHQRVFRQWFVLEIRCGKRCQMKRGNDTSGTTASPVAPSASGDAAAGSAVSAARNKGPAPAGHDVCESCLGTGEYPTDYGMVDCPDCSGSGHMPSRRIVVERRLRDVERAVEGGLRLKQDDMRWLLLEVRTLRQALRTVVALSHDGSDDTTATAQIRRTAEKALGESGRKPAEGAAASSDSLDGEVSSSKA